MVPSQEKMSVLGITSAKSDNALISSMLDGFKHHFFSASVRFDDPQIFSELEAVILKHRPNIFITYLRSLEFDKKIIQLLEDITKEHNLEPCYRIAITGDSSQEQLTQQLGELDVSTIMIFPLQPSVFRYNIQKCFDVHLDQSILSEKAEEASRIAMTAMESASEIGGVIHLIESLMYSVTYDDVAMEIGKVFSSMSLVHYLRIDDGHDVYQYSKAAVSDGVTHVLENAAMSDTRIVEHKRLLLFSFEHVTLLVSNAPWEDEEKYGRIKDLLCQIGAAVESRIRSLIVHNLIEEQHENVMTIMNMMRTISTDNQNHYRNIMKDLSDKLEIAAMSLDLNEEQEANLITLSEEALDSLESLYSASDAIENHFLELMLSITKVRQLTAERVLNARDDGNSDTVELF